MTWLGRGIKMDMQLWTSHKLQQSGGNSNKNEKCADQFADILAFH